MKRLRAVSVTKLFGALTHEIALDTGRGITIIHGANGTGKTTILRAISELSKTIPPFLGRLRFEEIRLDFDDRTSLRAKKDQEHLLLELHKNGRRVEHFSTEHLLKKEMWRAVQMELIESIPHGRIRFSGPEELIIDDHVVNADEWWQHLAPEVLSRRGRAKHLPRDSFVPDWLNEFWGEFQCTFIEEQRLLRVEEDRRRGKPLFKRVVEDYAVRLQSRIKDVLGAYAQHSQQLDRTFPARVVQALEAAPPDFSELKLRLAENEQRREKLQRAGLVDSATPDWYDDEKLKRTEVLRVLSVFAKDTETKLAQFDDIYTRITLFEDLVNSHFQRKEVKVSKDAGFILTLKGTGEQLDPGSLSSGEQHLLVLFFELILGGVQGAHLVMIDEPELSLHPAWQLKLIDDLERIRQVNHVDFVLATHSPQIIGDKWNLTRELSPKSE